MNYLAHLALSGKDEQVLIGNFMGDFAKGRLDHPRHAHFSVEIRQGFALHRFIDHFTDTHPVVLDCRNVLNDIFPRYASVIIDMYFDHFLAKNFGTYYPQTLHDFVSETYAILPRYENLYYPEMRPMVASILRYDWLTNYQHREGLERSFGGMAKRFPFLAGIENASDVLFENYDAYHRYFKLFYPELQMACDKQLVSLAVSKNINS